MGDIIGATTRDEARVIPSPGLDRVRMMASISSAEMRGQYRVVVLVAIPRVKPAERYGSRLFTCISRSLWTAASRHLGVLMVADRLRSVTHSSIPKEKYDGSLCRWVRRLDCGA